MGKKKLYVVIMYRWGNLEGHSYLLGVYDEKLKAKERGADEWVWRGCGKYTPHILEVGINKTKERKIIQSAENYR